MAQNNALELTCRPVVDADANVLICGSAPELLTHFWPNAARALPDQPDKSRFDLAVFVDPMAGADKQKFEETLAAARDRWAKQVVALIPLDSNTHELEETFFSLGFARRPLSESLSKLYIAYCFSISYYKNTPDWLNSKYWANPERWAKR